ncbi:hypothetical protein [Salinicola aestuarinus]|uniref:hypothetical protein n=1 Tax=Salinicola aestuarinus TaxID=1949082 RepID=UPI000DA18CD1|nr:hypothetical protein [Salinicola aestuarinus]
MTPDTKTFVTPWHQLGAHYDMHVVDASGQPDTCTRYIARQREHGEPGGGYRPALYVPSVDRLIVVIDRSFRDAGHARAYIANRVRMITQTRRQQQMPTTEDDVCA